MVTLIDLPVLSSFLFAIFINNFLSFVGHHTYSLMKMHNASFATCQGVWVLMKRCLTLCDIPEGNEERQAQLYSAKEVYDDLCHQSPTAMNGIERSTFGFSSRNSGHSRHG